MSGPATRCVPIDFGRSIGPATTFSQSIPCKKAQFTIRNRSKEHLLCTCVTCQAMGRRKSETVLKCVYAS